MSLQTLVALVVGGLIFLILGFKLLLMLWISVRGDRGWPGALVLKTTLGQAQAPGPLDFLAAPAGWSHYLGMEGQTTTALRPAGKVRLGERVVDVVSLHAWIDKGERVRVVQVEGARVVVDRPPVEVPAAPK